MTSATTQLGTLDYGILPPEINSARIYTGPGSGPILAAASAWGGLAAELSSAASSYTAVISELTDGSWGGLAAESMAAAATPYVEWMSTAAAQAEQTAGQAQAAAAAYEAAYAMTVPPAVVAANRAQQAALVATNVVGQNTAAIAATDALYAEMWAQDAAAMYGYASSSAAAATVTPFSSPPQTTNPAAAASQAGAVSQATATAAGTGTQSTLSQVISTVPSALQGLSSPLSSASGGVSPFAPGSNTATTGIAGFLNGLDGASGSAFGTFITSGLANGFLSGNWFNPSSRVRVNDGRVRRYRVLGGGRSSRYRRLQPGLVLGGYCTGGGEHRRTGPRRFGDRLSRVVGLWRIRGLGRCGPRDLGRDDVRAAKLGRVLAHARCRRPGHRHAGTGLDDPAGRGIRGSVRDAGHARHAGNADGSRRPTRLRIRRSALRVPPNRRCPSAGGRIAGGEAHDDLQTRHAKDARVAPSSARTSAMPGEMCTSLRHP